MISKWDTEDEQLSRKCLNEVIARVQDIEEPERIGMVAAQDIVNIILQNYGPEIYNKAVSDAAKVVSEQVEDIEYKLENLKQ